MKPRQAAPLAEAIPYTPKVLFFWNGLRTLQGGKKLPERLICEDLR